MLQPRKPFNSSGAQEILSSERKPFNSSGAEDILKKKEQSQSDVINQQSELDTQPTTTPPSSDTEKAITASESGTSNGTIKPEAVPKTIYVNTNPKYGPVEGIPKDIPYGTTYKEVKNSVELKRWREQNIQEPNVIQTEGKKAIKGVNKFLDAITSIGSFGTENIAPIHIPGGDDNTYQLAKKVDEFRTKLPDYSATANEEYEKAKTGSDWWQKTKEMGASALNFMADVMTQSVRGNEKPPEIKVDSPLKKYEDDVLKQASKNNETLSQEEIDKRTELSFKQDKINSLRQSDLNSFNYNLSPKEQSILENYSSSQISHLNNEQKDILKTISLTSAIADKSVSDFKEEQKAQARLLAQGVKITPEQTNALQLLKDKAEKDTQQLQYSQKQYFQNTNNLGTFEQEKYIFNKEGNRIIESLKRVGGSIETMASGATDFASYLAYTSSLLPGNKVGQALEPISAELHNKAVTIKRDVENTHKYLAETTDANTPEDYLNKVLNFTFESAPMVALGATGVGGIVTMGATTAGQKFGEEYDNKQDTWKKVVAPVLYGGAMMIPVAEGLKIVKNSKRAISAIEPELMKQTIKEYAKSSLKKVAKFGGEAFDTSVTFKAANLIQDVGVNHLILGKKIDYNKLYDAGLYEGVGFALLNKALPLVMGMATKPFFSEKEYKIIDANSKKILELTKELDKATKEEKVITQDVINALSKHSRDLIKEKLKQIESMPKPLKKKVIETYVEQSKLRQEALVVKGSKMSIENKKTALDIKQEEYREASKLRNDIISGTYLEIDLPENKLKYQDLAIKALEAENEGKSFNFKPEVIREKAIELLDKANKEKAKKTEEVKPTIELKEAPETINAEVKPTAEVLEVKTPQELPNTEKEVETVKAIDYTHINKNDTTDAETLAESNPIQGGAVTWKESVKSAIDKLNQAKKSGETVFDIAENKIREWYNKINEEIDSTGKSLLSFNDEDYATLSYYRASLHADLKGLETNLDSNDLATRQEALSKYNDIIAKVRMVDSVLLQARMVSGRAFGILKMTSKMDADNNLSVRRMEVLNSNKGEPLSKEQELEIAKLVAKEIENNKEGEKNLLKYSQEDFDAEVKRRLAEIKGKTTATKGDLGSKARQLAKDIREGKKSTLPDWAKAEGAKGSKSQGLDFDKAFAKALETFADVHDATKDFAKAIEEGFKHIEQWYKDNNLQLPSDIKGKFSDYSEENIVKLPKKGLSPETQRKLLINRLNKDIEDLEQQISEGQRKVVENKEDRYKNDKEVNYLRDKKKGLQEELSKIDPSYSERSKLERDLASAQKSLDEYQRKIDEGDYEIKQKEPKDINAELDKLRKERDAKRKEFEKERRNYNASIKEPETKQDILNVIKDLSENNTISQISIAKGYLNKLADLYLTDGLRGSEVFNAMFNDLKNIFPNMSEEQVRDAFLKKGEFKLESKKVIDKEMEMAKSELKNIITLEKKIQEVRDKKLKAKDDKERRKYTQEENDLISQLGKELGKSNLKLERGSKIEKEIKTKVANEHNAEIDKLVKNLKSKLDNYSSDSKEYKYLERAINGIERSKIDLSSAEDINSLISKSIGQLEVISTDSSSIDNGELTTEITNLNYNTKQNKTNSEQDILLNRYKKYTESKIKSIQKKIDNQEFDTEEKAIRSKKDAESIRLNLEAKQINAKFRRMREVAENKNKKLWERAISGATTFLIQEMIGGLGTGLTVAWSGLTKQPLNTITNMSFGYLAHKLTPELSKRAGAEARPTLLQEKHRYMAGFAQIGNEGMVKMWNKAGEELSQAKSNFEDIKKSSDTKKIQSAKNEYLKALVAHQSLFLYDWIGSKSWTDGADKFLKGASQMEELMGKGIKVSFGEMTGYEKAEMLVSLMGNAHGYLKNPSARAEYAAAFVSRLENKAFQQGIDISDPNIVLETAQESMVNYTMGKYQEDSYVTDAMSGISNALEKAGEKPSESGVSREPKNKNLGKFARFVFKAKNPIFRTSSNITRESIQEYLFGIPYGAIVHGNAIRKGVFAGLKVDENVKESMAKELDKLGSDKIDLIYRCYRKGGAGMVLIALTSMGLVRYGGFPGDKDKKREEGELKQGELEIAGHNLGHGYASKMLGHMSLMKEVAYTSDFIRIIKKSNKVAETKMEKVYDAVTSNLIHIVKEIPTMGDYSNPLYSPSVPYGRAAGDISKMFDVDKEGHEIERDKTKWLNRLKINTGFRSTVEPGEDLTPMSDAKMMEELKKKIK